MTHRVYVIVNHQIIGLGVATTEHVTSCYGQPVIVISDSWPAGPYPWTLTPGIYGPLDLPADARILDGTTNATPEWLDKIGRASCRERV